MKKFVTILTGFFVLIHVSGYAQENTINLYGSPEPRAIQALVETFEHRSGIKVNWVRLSTGETLTRLRAEKDAPWGDVWWGGTLDPHAIAAFEGLTEPYCPSGYHQIDPRFRDALGECQVIGVYVGILGFAVNTTMLQEKGLPIPTGWEDLLDPDYKGLIGMANPNTSGTALTILLTQVFRKGEENGQKIDEDEAIEYMKKLHQNVAEYTKSGTAPGRMAGEGEIAIAIEFLHDAIYQAEQGYSVTPLIPKEGTGYEIGGLNLIKGAPHPELAKPFIDWVITAEAQETQAPVGAYQLPTNIVAKAPSLPIPLHELRTVNYDFTWVAQNGKRILERWTREVFPLSR